MVDERNQPASILLAEEHFSTEDEGFVECLRKVRNPDRLAAFANRWKVDPRPWARAKIFEYLRLSPDRVGHHPVVKRLFKHAEASQDDELMSEFAVYFDRLVRHEVRTRSRFDFSAGAVLLEDHLATSAPKLTDGRETVTKDWRGKPVTLPPLPPRKGAVYFSYATRYYLQRRVDRYFRRIAYRDPQRYSKAVLRILSLYEDADLDRGERILDCRTLLSICFRHEDALRFGADRVRLKSGRGIAELEPAPRFPDLWRSPEAFETLFELLRSARSRFVQVWAIRLVERDHVETLGQQPVERILSLLDSKSPDVQAFGAKVFREAPFLSRLPIETWLRLLAVRSPAASETVCDAMRREVLAERLTLAQCVELTARESATVAELGFEYLREKSLETDEDRRLLSELSDARCVALAEKIADWALAIVGSPSHYDREAVLRFFDSVSSSIRRGASSWLVADGSPGADDPTLMGRLMETPFDDIRLRIVDLLESGNSAVRRDSDELSMVWRSVLLGVARGGRQKLKATRQLANAILDAPERAEELIPVLGAAVRSVRDPESRAGLAALVRIATVRPETLPTIRRHIPQFEFVDAEPVS